MSNNMSNNNDYEGLNIEGLPQEPVQYPCLYWRNQEAAFSFKVEDHDEDLTVLEGAEEVEIYKDEPMVLVPKLRVALIALRKNFFTEDAGRRTYHPKYVKDVTKILTDYLLLVDGLGDSPKVLRVHGMPGGRMADIYRAYTGRILPKKQRTLAQEQVAVSWSYWLSLECETDARGKQLKTRSEKGATVYLPVCSCPISFEEAEREAYVGRDILRLGAAIFQESREWQKYNFALAAKDDEEDKEVDVFAPNPTQSPSDDSASIGRVALELQNLRIQADNFIEDLLKAAPDRKDLPDAPELPTNLTSLPLAELDKLNRSWLKFVGKLEYMAQF
jgi:hypothetical protein